MGRPAIATRRLIAGLLIAQHAGAQVLTFARTDYPSDTGARGMVSADFNRDGWSDVAHANVGRNSVTVLLNHAGASFIRAFEVAVGAGPFDLTTADFNRDGIPDLAVANADGNSISVLLGRGNGAFTRTDIAAPAQQPRGIATADVNRDGRPDIVYTGFATGTGQVLLGNGTGAFTTGPRYPAAGAQPQGVAAGDFNHDAFLDVVIAASDGLRILYGTNGATVSARTIPGQAHLNVLAPGDVNGDGWLDVVAAATGQSAAAIYLNGPSGLRYARSYAVGASPRGVALADLNDDGRLDVITANRASSTVSILAGDVVHPGAFLPREDVAAASGSRALVSGDFDGDGRQDVVTGNEYTARVTVLSNVTLFEPSAFTFSVLSQPGDVELGGGEAFRHGRGRGFGTADFNRDGRLDFVIPGVMPEAPSVVVMLRDGPTVILPGATPLVDFLLDDFNGDGSADVLAFGADPMMSPPVTRFITHLGDGHGHFTAAPATTAPELRDSCVAGDLNRDGRTDLVCDTLVLTGNGNGTFAAGTEAALMLPDGSVPGGPRLADVNRDGKLDVVYNRAVALGDGAGGLTLGQTFEELDFVGETVSAVVDLDRDGYVDLVAGSFFDLLWVAFGSPDGFQRVDRYTTGEGYSSLIVADLNEDGNQDLVVNASPDPENFGVMIFFGRADGTFTQQDRRRFVLPHGPALVADLTGDGLLDVAAYDADAVHVLVNERNGVNHQPEVPDYSVTLGYPCVTLDARAMDPDQHVLTVAWFDSSGTAIGGGIGMGSALDVCVERPGTYRYSRTAVDGFGGTATGTVAFTYVAALKELVLYAAAGNVAMAGTWSRIADSTAAGGFRAHDASLGAPKVLQASPAPANRITIPFIADPNLTYKLWLRLKADANSFNNDSVWVQFSSSNEVVPGQFYAYTVGSPFGLLVSLEECVNCGVSGWGWQDDGFGAVNKNGILLRFDAGPQTIVIQTREDGVSIDQVVLSAERYLTQPPGPAKNDQTILPASSP